MELEQYLEKDIITFLEGKIDKKENVVIDREEEFGIYLTRDYLKELSYALDNDELTKAKRLFDELKKAFARLPKSSIERKKTYALLEKMYDKIQNYVKIKEGKIEIIKQGDSEIFKDNTDQFSDLSTRLSDKESQGLNVEVENAGLPISLGKNKKTKEDSEESIGDKEKKDQEDNASVESKITFKGNRSYNAESDKKDSEEEKDDEMSQKNVFFTKKPKVIEQEKDSKKSQSIILREYGIGSDIIPEGYTEDILYYIDTNTEKLDKLKTHVITKLLDDLRKQIEEAKSEEERKIESLKKELVEQMTEELNKKLDVEKYKLSQNENLREDIIKKVYKEARQIISSNDRYEEEIDTGFKKNKDSYVVKNPTVNIHMESIDKNNNFAEELNNLQKANPKHRHDDEKINEMYEEAIYTMFQNNYNDAAKIFEQILRIKPGSKAAQIRLHECIEAIGNA